MRGEGGRKEGRKGEEKRRKKERAMKKKRILGVRQFLQGKETGHDPLRVEAGYSFCDCLEKI